MHYVSFGSNNSRSDMERWCGQRGVSNPLDNPLGTGWVLDHAPVFHYFSSSRGGGALDIKPQLGAATPCVVWEISEEQLQTIDRKEGAPRCYERCMVPVQLSNGDFLWATTHRVSSASIDPSGFVAPTDEYIEIVGAALLRHGLNDDWLAPCAKGESACLVNSLFVYGTLMSGEMRFPPLKLLDPAMEISSCEIDGRLLDCGSYPGARFGGDEKIHGELMKTSDIASVLTHCDVVEGFTEFGNSENLYDRVLVTDEQTENLAWSYQFNRELNEIIPSGDWRNRGE